MEPSRTISLEVKVISKSSWAAKLLLSAYWGNGGSGGGATGSFCIYSLKMFSATTLHAMYTGFQDPFPNPESTLWGKVYQHAVLKRHCKEAGFQDPFPNPG